MLAFLLLFLGGGGRALEPLGAASGTSQTTGYTERERPNSVLVLGIRTGTVDIFVAKLEIPMSSATWLLWHPTIFD